MTNKKVIYQDMPIENARKSVGAIEKLRNRDTDGDGRCDFVDNNYNKPSDVYLKLSEEEYQRLLQTKRDEYISNTRKSGDHYIVKCSEANKDEVVRLIRTVKHSMPMT